MKYLMLAGVLLFSTILYSQESDAVKKANKQNEAKAKAGGIDEECAEFLVRATDARMMDSQEGEMAMKNGTSNEIKSYGKLMVNDQARMLTSIKKLAAQKKISLPATISEKKAEGRADLEKEMGRDFDEKFIKMMIIDHKRDVKEFEEAMKSSDLEVKAFATKYLPLIKSHLQKAEQLKDMQKKS